MYADCTIRYLHELQVFAASPPASFVHIDGLQVVRTRRDPEVTTCAGPMRIVMCTHRTTISRSLSCRHGLHRILAFCSAMGFLCPVYVGGMISCLDPCVSCLTAKDIGPVSYLMPDVYRAQ